MNINLKNVAIPFLKILNWI